MAARGTRQELTLLLDLLDQSYDKKAWHGPNLRGSVRRLEAAEAGWRPAPKRHSVAEHVVHAAYWKYAIRRRLRGDLRGSFPLKGSNWFAVSDTLTPDAWKGYLDLLETEHRALRAAVAGFPAASLHEYRGGKTFTAAALIYGAASHDLYHTGQIQLIKRLMPAGEGSGAGKSPRRSRQ